MTKDAVRRVSEHQLDRGARHTCAHLPLRLVAAWRFPIRSAALPAEARFKRLARCRKLGFVRCRLPLMDSAFAHATVERLEEVDP